MIKDKFGANSKHKIGDTENESEYSFSEDGKSFFLIFDKSPYSIFPLEKTFKIFQMLDAKPSRQSTGMGLTYSEENNRFIQWKDMSWSHNRQRTAFYFTLPKQ